MPNPDSGPDIGPDQNGEGQGNQTDNPTPPVPLVWSFDLAAPTQPVLAISSEWHIVLASAKQADGAYLTSAEVAELGVQIAFVADASAPPNPEDWLDMAVQNKTVSGTYAPAYVLVGPDAGGTLELTPGTWQRYVRTKNAPRTVRKLAPLTVDGPNPTQPA